MACVLFLDLGTAGVAPWWVTLLFVLLWLVLLRLATRWFVPHPRRVPWLPLLGVPGVAGDDRARHQPARLALSAQPVRADPEHGVVAVPVGRGHQQVAVGEVGHRAQPTEALQRRPAYASPTKRPDVSKRMNISREPLSAATASVPW